jgi:hypothetical protein
MLFYKGVAVIDMIVHPSRADTAEASQMLDFTGSAWAVVDSLEYMEEKKKQKWVLALGTPHKIFVASMGMQMPSPGDDVVVVKMDKTTGMSSVLAQKVHLSGTYSFDPLTKKILMDSAKTISVRVGLADYNKVVKIHDPKTGKKWVQYDPKKSENDTEMHMPLDIRNVSDDIFETKTEVTPTQSLLPRCASHLTPHTSRLTPHASHLTAGDT